MSENAGFERGQVVRLQSQPERCGAVIDINESGPEVQYTVFLCGKTRTFFAFQLIPDDFAVNSKKTLSASECRALPTARYINDPGISMLYRFACPAKFAINW